MAGIRYQSCTPMKGCFGSWLDFHVKRSPTMELSKVFLARSCEFLVARIVLGGMASDVEATEAIELQVLCLTGEGFNFKLDKSTFGYQVQQMVSTQLPGREGAKIVLHHMEAKLVLTESLEQQGIAGKATLSCTYVPTDLHLAWCYVHGLPTPEAGCSLEGLASLKVRTPGEYLFHLPKGLRTLILDLPYISAGRICVRCLCQAACWTWRLALTSTRAWIISLFQAAYKT